MKTGSCLCCAVKYEIHSPLGPVLACHCIQCRKQTGNYWSSIEVADRDLKFTTDDRLKLYRSSPAAQRGFCSECGSTLLWKKDGSDTTSITAGTIDGPTGAQLKGHIFCESADDYYEIAGGAFRLDRW